MTIFSSNDLLQGLMKRVVLNESKTLLVNEAKIIGKSFCFFLKNCIGLNISQICFLASRSLSHKEKPNFLCLCAVKRLLLLTVLFGKRS